MDVFWTIRSLEEIDQIQDFIAEDSPAAAYRLTSNIVGRSSALLSAHPLSGRRGRAPDTRELVVSGTPCIVVYPIRERIEILAVFHASREWPESS